MTGHVISETRVPPARPLQVQWDDAYKLPRDSRYFNISVIWIAYFPMLLRLFHYLRIRHEVVTVASIILGLASAWTYAQAGTYVTLLIAAALIHFKDVTDACDGALARLTGTGHRVGRFLDTLGDGLTFFAVFLALAWRTFHISGDPFVWVWAAFALTCLYLQCSFFNYYHLSYVHSLDHASTSRIDERIGENDDRCSKSEDPGGLLKFLQRVYSVVFGWQDRLMFRLDGHLLNLVRGTAENDQKFAGRWYGDRRLLTAQSLLCFGSHIFALIALTVADRTEWYFTVIAVGFNLYWLSVIIARVIRFRRRPLSSA